MASPEIATSAPWVVVTGATVTYSSVLALLNVQSSKRQGELRFLVKAISAGHATATTVLAVLALSRRWTVPRTRFNEATGGSGWLDDSDNSWVVGKSHLADFLTAWETGYLIYDTGALFLISYHLKRTSFRAATAHFLKNSPVFIAHHILLTSALLWLQAYIATGRAKGVRIIVAFFLMNASNPLLHLRWWRKKVTGSRDKRIDSALATVFALTRFGTIYWVCKAYGLHHGMNAWEAIKSQRWQCKAGTGLLTGFNALWWFALLRQVVRAN